MMIIEMENSEWNQVLTILATAPCAWNITNPLIVKIAQQMRSQQPPVPAGTSLEKTNGQASSAGFERGQAGI